MTGNTYLEMKLFKNPFARLFAKLTQEIGK